MHKVFGWFDGAVEPYNPGGHGGWGYVLEGEGGESVGSGYGYVPAAPDVTNNVLEYRAALEAVKAWHALPEAYGHGVLVLYGDSKLVVEQMRGAWRVNGGAYVATRKELVKYVADIGASVDWNWIPREENGRADELSKKALSERGIRTTVRR